MSFDTRHLDELIAQYGPVVRVVIASAEGSTPRETGAAMIVWQGGQAGTIGGGALEFQAAALVREVLTGEHHHMLRSFPLGPALGQCCGGHVRLLFERFTRSNLPKGPLFARPMDGISRAAPLKVRHLQNAARAQGALPVPQVVDGWFVEPVQTTRVPLWVYGAGHVGRALMHVLAPLPDFDITWVDTDHARYPAEVSPGIRVLPAANPADAVRFAPPLAHHLVLTYSHALDLELCHRLLLHGFEGAGLIGSATKWVRFQKRLAGLGHNAEAISRITCPIGRPELGKHPQAIAIGVAETLLLTTRSQRSLNLVSGEASR